MTTFYLDYEGGSDAADGLSFANRWKTFNLGATAVRIAPGDTIRVMASPNPTSLGVTAAWKNAVVEGNHTGRAIASSTNASPIVVTLSAANYTLLAPAVGDTVWINGHTINTNANGTWLIIAVNGTTTVTLGLPDGSNSTGNGVGGASGQIYKPQRALMLSAPLTKNIACCGNENRKPNWTASANVTCVLSAGDSKEGMSSVQRITIAAAFGTGVAAYVPITSADFSAYEQVSFWFESISGTIPVAGDYQLELCSDVLGAVPVDVIPIPAMRANNFWTAMCVNKGSALGAAIQSVALRVNVDRGAMIFQIDNIIAVKAASDPASLSLTSLIGKGVADEPWLAIQSINGERVMLDGHTPAIMSATMPRGYAGVTETVAAYKREPIPFTGSANHSIVDSGTAGNLITFSGGWDRTDMSVQNGESWYTGQGTTPPGLTISNQSYVRVDKFGFVRCNIGAQIMNNTGIEIGALYCNNSTGYGVYLSDSHGLVVDSLMLDCNFSAGLYLGAGGKRQTFTKLRSCSSGNEQGVYGQAGGIYSGGKWGEVKTWNNNTIGFGLFPSIGATVASLDTRYNGTYGLYFQGIGASPTRDNRINWLEAHHNVSAAIYIGQYHPFDNHIGGGNTSGNASTFYMQATGGWNYARNLTAADDTLVGLITANLDGRFHIERFGGVVGDNRIYSDAIIVQSQTGVVVDAGRATWEFALSGDRTLLNPFKMQMWAFAVKANQLVTLTAKMRRAHASISQRLICYGGQLAGVAEVYTDMAAAIDTWEDVTITFTPTEAGVIEVHTEVWGTVNDSAFCDPKPVVLTQA